MGSVLISDFGWAANEGSSWSRRSATQRRGTGRTSSPLKSSRPSLPRAVTCYSAPETSSRAGRANRCSSF